MFLQQCWKERPRYSGISPFGANLACALPATLTFASHQMLPCFVFITLVFIQAFCPRQALKLPVSND
ncbi:hypothetical protein HYQ45_013319 [Verticillium longisporum]|uniref:Uncharacterized protein n=1 Tax=Verticillium longisporum TaxID=100787 RepID=A0A8I2ZEB0_VERLO|nr:hypothetical protein HYQ44_017946 [Verticillium longisporum]KAG7125316.1 hypothetical protein HYQ45_013319 [Verticillium longisporum]